MTTFGNWEPELHDDFQQVKRILSAQSRKMEREVVDFDEENQTIVMQGSSDEPYTATLNECTCMDFSIRRRPCKHMYYLAFQLGLISDLPIYNKRKSKFKAKEEIEKYKDLYLSGQISAEVYVKLGDALSKV